MNGRNNRAWLLTIAVVLVASCSDPQADFDKAMATGTDQALTEFIERHPDSALVGQAKDRIAEIAFREVQSRNSIEAYENYLRQYPDAPNLAVASQTLVKLEYARAVDADDIPSLERFLSKYGESDRAPDARVRLEERLEIRDWAAARAANTQSAYQQFMDAFPDNSRVRIAKGNLVGAVRIMGEGGRILIASGDLTFRIVSTSDERFPPVDLSGHEAAKFSFVPVDAKGRYAINYESQYSYVDASAIAIKDESDQYQLIHFEYSNISESPRPADSLPFRVNGHVKGIIADTATIEGLPTLDP